MRKKWKTSFCCVLALGMALAAAGCGKSDDGGQKNAESAAPQQDKKYDISWTAYQLAPLDADAPMIKYWDDLFNVNMQVWNIDAKNYDELISLKFAAGEIPDQTRVQSYANLQKYTDQNILAEIPEDMIKKNAPGLYKQYIDNNPDHKFNYGKIDGKIYGIPGLNFRGVYRDPLVFRGDWMKKVGITKTPDTLDEFEAMIYKFANDDPDGDGKKDTYGLSASGLMSVFGAFGYLPWANATDLQSPRDQWQVRDGKLVYGAVQPEMKDALKLIHKWYQDGVLDPEFITGENKGGAATLSNAFVSGRIGVSAQGAFIQWNPKFPGRSKEGKNRMELRKLNPAAADALVYALPPKGPTGKRGAVQQQMVTPAFVSFGKQLEKQPDKMAKILQMIDYMCFSTYEHYADSAYGVGNWKMEDGLLTPQGKFVEPVEAAKIGAHNVSQVLPNVDFKNKDFEPYRDWLKETQMTVGGLPNRLETALPSENKYSVELAKLRDEAYISIITGDKPLDYFDEFVKKWRAGGGDQLEKEANQWYAANNKK